MPAMDSRRAHANVVHASGPSGATGPSPNPELAASSAPATNPGALTGVTLLAGTKAGGTRDGMVTTCTSGSFGVSREEMGAGIVGAAAKASGAGGVTTDAGVDADSVGEAEDCVGEESVGESFSLARTLAR